MGTKSQNHIRIKRNAPANSAPLSTLASFKVNSGISLDFNKIFELPLQNPGFDFPAPRLLNEFPDIIDNFIKVNPQLKKQKSVHGTNYLLEFPVPPEVESRGFPTTLSIEVNRYNRPDDTFSIDFSVYRFSGPRENPHMYTFHLGKIKYVGCYDEQNPKIQPLSTVELNYGRDSTIDGQIYLQRIVQQLLDSRGNLRLPH